MSESSGAGNADAPELRTVGVIIGAHGLDGTLKITPLSDFPERFDALDSVFLWKKGESPSPDRVNRVRWSGASALITVRGVTNREDAQMWRGAELCVREEDRWELPPDVYYVTDLLGFTAVSQDDLPIGVLRNIIASAQDILEIEREGAESLLVPFVRRWVGRVDVQARTIEILNWRDLTAPEIVESDSDDD